MSDFRTKDPQAKIYYTWNFGKERLTPGDSITTFAITSAPEGITVTDQSNTSTTVKAKIGGGTLDVIYAIVCHINTLGGEEHDWTLYIKIEPE